MKKFWNTLLFVSLSSIVCAQLNTTLQSHISYPFELSNIWGWVAPDGTEYALVGVRNGVSIVSLADPRNAREVAFVPGAFSRWREIKTWGHFAYVVVDEPGTSNGVTVIDLSELPARATHYEWRPEIETQRLGRCHNIYIDEKGLCYLTGCTINSGGILFVDVFSAPSEPVYLGKGPAIYAHDVYALRDTMYASEIYLGRLGVYDIKNLNNVQLLAAQNTPFRFTHNAWLSDNGKVIYTTDERANAPVAAYDISNLNDIKELAQFRAIYTLGTGAIPHNVHVKDDFLFISYYTAGGVIVDGSRPDNLVEVANYDTYPGDGGGFFGAWGIYPYLPSGNVLISDINTGMFVVKPELKRACFLEGRISDARTGAPLFDARVEILSEQPNMATSKLDGNYKTGQVLAGTFEVSFQKNGYVPKIVSATLQNGQVTILDVALEPLSAVSINGKAISSANGAGVPNAKLLLKNDVFEYEITADANGNFNLSNVIVGTYGFYAGAWGYLHRFEPGISVNNNQTITITLDPGYQDDFIFDLGWNTQIINATAGFWERDVPIGTFFSGALANPDRDSPNDLGEACYVTGNGGGGPGDDDLDNGIVRLISPPMDLTTYTNPIISYELWFFNDGGNGNPDDSLVVRLSNGVDTVILEKITESRSSWRPRSEFRVRDHITLSNNMTLIFQASDLPLNGHIVEAAVDAILVEEGEPTLIREPQWLQADLQVWPNPFAETLQVQYSLPRFTASATLWVYNLLGQPVLQMPLREQSSLLNLGAQLDKGVYLLQITSEGQMTRPLRVIKM